MNATLFRACLLAGMALLCACAPVRYVRPLEQGQIAVQGSFGGHLIQNFGPPIPIPFTTLGAGYGLSSQTTVHMNLHPTAAVFGVVQTDLGLSHAFLRPAGWRPGFTAGLVINAAVDVWEGRGGVWPQADAHAWWEYGARRHYAYAGMSLWGEFRGTRAHGEPQGPQLFPVVQAGNVFSREKMDYSLELKWSAPNLPNERITVDYASLGGRGALGFYLGFTRKF